MKIIHIMSGGDIGGAKTHIMSLVSALDATHDVLLVSLRVGNFANEMAQLGIKTEIISAANILKSKKILEKIINNFSPDIIHTHGAKANMMGAITKKNIPLVTTVHSDYKLDYLGNPLKQLVFGGINAISLRKIDFYQPVSDVMAKTLIKRGFNPQRILRIYNGMNFNKKNSDFDRYKYFKENFNITINPNDILCGIAARLTAIKDIETAILGFNEAYQTHKNLKFFIAGIGEEQQKLENLVKSLKLENSVVFCGWISDMDSFFSAIDINILSSLSEGFPYALLEGAYANCAIISTDVGGIPELIENGEDGILFTPKDFNALGQAISNLAKNPDIIKSFSEKIREKVIQTYSVDNVCINQANNYKHIIQKYSNKKSVVVCGAYGKGNAGDEAILKSINLELKLVDPIMDICVLSRNPNETREFHRISSIYTFNFFSMIKNFKTADVYINGGGSLIQDVTSTRSLYYYLFTLFLAKKMNCKVMMYGCGIGPVSLEKNRKLATKVINKYVDVITLRDDTSRSELEKMGVCTPKIIMSADPTLILRQANDSQINKALLLENINPCANYIGFGLRKWNSFDAVCGEIAKSAQYSYEKYGLIPLFIPIEHPNDVFVAEKVANMLSCPYKIIRERHSIETTIGIFAKMKCVVGIRLHSLMFSAGRGVPVVGLSYDVKVDGFLKYIGSTTCIALDEISEKSINLAIDDCISGRLDESVSNTSKMLIEREGQNVICLKKLLEEK